MCCSDFTVKVKTKFKKILGTIETLRKICRVIALLDAIFGLMFLIVLLVIKSLYAKQHKTWSDANIVRVVLLSILGLQMLFALILYEGARRGILCLIKTWLIFSLIRMLIPVVIISGTLLSGKAMKNEKRLFGHFAIEIGVTVFHLIEAIFILAFHKQSKNIQNIENATELPDRENFWLELEDLKDIRQSFYPTAPPHTDQGTQLVLEIENENENTSPKHN